jgi:hypothetical protein
MSDPLQKLTEDQKKFIVKVNDMWKSWDLTEQQKAYCSDPYTIYRFQKI